MNCVCCGIAIPDNQKICSMCYGDPHYGNDGYYQQWLDEDRQRKQMDRLEEESEVERHNDS